LCLRTVSALNFLSVSFSFSGRLLTQAKKQGGNALGGRLGMLLYERIKLQQKKLYLEAIKNLIFQYEHQYNDDSHEILLEKLKQTTIDSFSTVEHFFKIEFGENKQDEVKFSYSLCP
jgi:hypothetical protein